MADKRGMKAAILSLLAVLLAFATPVVAERPVTVFAAASLGGVLEEIAQEYAEPVVFAYGGSGVMARQVAAGAPADLVILANPVWMDWLAGQGLVDATKVALVAGNALVVIAGADAEPLEDVAQLPARLKGARLAMGHRDAVPAGSYARQWLQRAGLWQALSAQLAETDNVRAALALVSQGQLPMGVVYASDARAAPDVAVIYAVPAQDHDPIRYPAAALSPKGADFLDHLLHSKSVETFVAYGFQRVTAP